MDGSSNDGGLRVGLILVIPEGHRMNYALKFGFKASNNEAKYEALIAGLELAKEMKVESLDIFSDSQLVVCQINDEYQAREKKMAAYLHKAKKIIGVIQLVHNPLDPEGTERGSRRSHSTHLSK